MSKPKRKRTNGEIISALRKHAGIAARAARELGLTRGGICLRIQSSPDIQTALCEMREELKDLGEGNIVKALKKGDMQTTRWFLERQAKDRGYATKVENENRLSDIDLEAIVAGFGGDVQKLRAAKAALDPGYTAPTGKP